MSEFDAIAEANAAFYDAVRSGDMNAIEQMWARRGPAVCIHPGWPAIMVRPGIMDSWRRIFDSAPPAIEPTDVTVQKDGELGVVVCYERVGGGTLVATNLFRLEEGAWRIFHHQAGPAPDMPREQQPEDGESTH